MDSLKEIEYRIKYLFEYEEYSKERFEGAAEINTSIINWLKENHYSLFFEDEKSLALSCIDEIVTTVIQLKLEDHHPLVYTINEVATSIVTAYSMDVEDEGMEVEDEDMEVEDEGMEVEDEDMEIEELIKGLDKLTDESSISSSDHSPIEEDRELTTPIDYSFKASKERLNRLKEIIREQNNIRSRSYADIEGKEYFERLEIEKYNLTQDILYSLETQIEDLNSLFTSRDEYFDFLNFACEQGVAIKLLDFSSIQEIPRLEKAEEKDLSEEEKQEKAEEESVQRIISLIESAKSLGGLELFFLQSSRLKSSSILTIVQSLAKVDTLYSLDLSNNSEDKAFSEEELQAIFSALFQINSLKHLNFANNRINGEFLLKFFPYNDWKLEGAARELNLNILL